MIQPIIFLFFTTKQLGKIWANRLTIKQINKIPELGKKQYLYPSSNFFLVFQVLDFFYKLLVVNSFSTI